MNSAANTARPMIATFKIFALGRSGRRVSLKRGVSFGVELVWSNGVTTEMATRFPAMGAAATYGAKVYKVADAQGVIATA